MKIIEQPLFQRLIEATPFSRDELYLLILTAPSRYKDHQILKRHGRGKRLISQPTKEVKYIQRVIVSHELSDLNVNSAATAYVGGRSIKDHAKPHAKHRYLLKLDFKDFFPSITEDVVQYCLRRDRQYTEAELLIICRLLCRRPKGESKLRLSIGAPSSPFVSNYVMVEFDRLIGKFVEERGGTYTRYADDLALSTSEPGLLDVFEGEVRRLLSEDVAYLGLSLNEEKTVNVSKKNKRSLTGLILSNAGEVSIGRERKRKLRAAINAYSKGRLSPQEVATLRGQLAFIWSVDRPFVAGLLARLGLGRLSDL